MTQRIDVDVRVSLELPKRANFSAKVGVSELAQRVASRIVERARQEITDVPGLVLSVQPPKERRYDDPKSEGADTAAAETVSGGGEAPGADHPPAGAPPADGSADAEPAARKGKVAA